MQQLRGRLAKFTDLRTSVRNAPSFNIGSGNWDIDFVLRGPDLVALAEYAERLRVRSKDLGIIDADTTLKLDNPELRVVIDRKRAADLNVDTENIATALRLMVGGDTEVSRFIDPTVNQEYDVQLRLSQGDREDTATISRLYVPRAGAGLVRLDNLVQVESARSASRIDRLDRQRQVSLRAGIAPGFALADRIEALQQAVREMNLPIEYSTSVSGRGRELQRTFTEFLWAFLLSIIFMYMILASQYESTIHPLTILLSLPLSVPFALFSLWMTGNTLNLVLGAGYSGALRCRQEKFDFTDRSHEPASGGRAGTDGRDHASEPRPAAAHFDDLLGVGGRHAASGHGLRPRRGGAPRRCRCRDRGTDVMPAANPASYAGGLFDV